MSQKQPSTVKFDGTGITVFDIKREIINANKLTSGTDFDLVLENPDTKEKYEDDTQVLQRSTSVLVRRMPLKSRGKGKGVQRYVNGTGPKVVRKQAPVPSSTMNNSNNAAIPVSGTEEDKIKAMLQVQSDQWKETQQHMASATPIYNKSSSHADGPPPPGYVCYRCGAKDHWIKNCPTNDDPNWEGKRVKRTTGIPKTFLKTVANPAEGDTDQGNYMITEDGQYVVAVADDKSWKSHQQKSRAAEKARTSDANTDPTLVCPLTHKLFIHPVKTPCCGKTYEDDAIQQALMDDDFKCPNCGKDEVLLEQLIKDSDIEAKLLKLKEDQTSNLENKSSKRKREDEETPDVKKLKIESESESESLSSVSNSNKNSRSNSPIKTNTTDISENSSESAVKENINEKVVTNNIPSTNNNMNGNDWPFPPPMMNQGGLPMMPMFPMGPMQPPMGMSIPMNMNMGMGMMNMPMQPPMGMNMNMNMPFPMMDPMMNMNMPMNGMPPLMNMNNMNNMNNNMNNNGPYLRNANNKKKYNQRVRAPDFHVL